MSRAAAPFSPRAVLAVLIVGAATFLLCLYAIGAGWGARDSTGGSGHAASNGLNGYAALVELLQHRGFAVSTSRNRAHLDDRALLVLTPQHDTDTKALSKLLARRRYEGPTLLILPKWFAFNVSGLARTNGVRRGWVQLGPATSPEWFRRLNGFENTDLRLTKTASWSGLGRRGSLPARGQSLYGPTLASLVGDGSGRSLAAFVDDGGYYPTLLPLVGRAVDPNAPRRWALTVVAEPDLFNNQGLADEGRARVAVELVQAAREDPSLPVVFDLTLAGLAGSANLLTLAFEPPFLAATLCLLLAAALVAWRALRRFGPPVAERSALELGKRQLARNGAALIERSRRWHLLGPPYAALLAGRIAARLGIREPHGEARDRAVARLLAARGVVDDYPTLLADLRTAHGSADLLRAARALTHLERTLAR